MIEYCNAVVENNIIIDNEGNGTTLQNNLGSTDIVIGNNTIRHNVGYGLRIIESNGVTIYNGIFEDNMRGGIDVLAVSLVYPTNSGSQVKWIVNAGTSVKDNSVFFSGDVVVSAGGVLTIDSVPDFTVGEAETGVTMLSVDLGGSLIVLNSDMYSANHRGLFLVYGNLQMTSSSVIEWSQIYLANTSKAKITACTISYNDRNGIYVAGSNPTISSTTITANGMDGIFVDAGSKPTIKSCIIALNERGIYARNANLDNVVDNIFALNTVAGIYAEGAVGKIHANIFLMDKNEIFVYNSVVSIEDNEIGYARLIDQVARYSTVLSLLLSYSNNSDISDMISSFTGGIPSSSYLSPMLLGHVGVYAVNSDVTAKDNTYGMLTYALYAENSTISFSDTVKENTILLQWLNSNLDTKNISIPTFVYNGIYAIDSKVRITGGSIQCLNDALFLDDSSAVISDSALNASRFDIYAEHQSNVSMGTTTLDGKLKVADNGWIAWLNQFTVIVKDVEGRLVSGAPVTVVDGSGKLIAGGNTDSNGQFRADVIGWTQTVNGKQSVTTPYWVNATVGGKTISQSVDGSQSQTISAQAQKSMIDSVMLPLLLIIALVVVLVVIAVVLRIRKI
jgi:parallel beta-helix repeat protein